MDIFENLDKNNFNLCKHVYELNTMLYEEKPFYYYRQTLSFAQIFEKYCLRKWKMRKRAYRFTIFIKRFKHRFHFRKYSTKR